MRVAAVVSCMRHRSHAHVILENFLGPYLFNGRVVEPDCDVVLTTPQFMFQVE